VRPAVVLLAASGLAALACTSSETPSCPGQPVATFRFKGHLVHEGDPILEGLEPDDTLPDCTLDPADPEEPIRYPRLLTPFDARIAATPETGAAALCRANGVVFSGELTGPSSYSFEADASAAILCEAACAASLRIAIAGDVALDPEGQPEAFDGILVEVLTAARGDCTGCLPAVEGADPPKAACAARYALEGRLR
jgi:hypothetical protein